MDKDDQLGYDKVMGDNRMEPKPHADNGGIPSWVTKLGVAAWVRGPDGTITHMNQKAEELLGRRAASCVGKPCHLVIRGRDATGAPICSKRCRSWALAAGDRPIGCVHMRVPRPGGDVHLQIIVISADTDGESEPSLVHCAVDVDCEQGLMTYFNRIASRSRGRRKVRGEPTKRELEILRLLSRDETLYSISLRLGISYSTVRNHVQHALHKLGVHSIMEAVAWYLLTERKRH